MVAIVVMIHKIDDGLWFAGPMESGKLKQNAMHDNIMASWQTPFIEDILVLEASCDALE